MGNIGISKIDFLQYRLHIQAATHRVAWYIQPVRLEICDNYLICKIAK